MADFQRCSEFGACDGLYLYTAARWTDGWSAILTGRVRERDEELHRNVVGYDCITVNCFVGIDGNAHLASIFERHGVPLEADFR
jgi:hypothetical protein